MHTQIILCTGVCPTLTNPANGEVVVNSLFVDSIARYSCEPEYEMVGTPSCTCQSTGSWSSSPPTCERKSLTSKYFIFYSQVASAYNRYNYSIVKYLCILILTYIV